MSRSPLCVRISVGTPAAMHKLLIFIIACLPLVKLFVGILVDRKAKPRVDVDRRVIARGEDVILRCSVEDLKADFAVVWTKDRQGVSFNYILERGIVLATDSHSIHGESPGSFDLKITDFQEDYAGEYRCTVVDERTNETKVQSEAVVLKYVEKNQTPECSMIPRNVSFVTMDVNVVLLCKLLRSHGKARLTWSAVSAGTNNILQEYNYDDEYHVYNRYTWRPTKEDKGRSFTCYSQNPGLKIPISDSPSCSLGPFEVLYPPSVKLRQVQPDLEIGSEADFECLSDSSPPVTSYKWKINSMEVSAETPGMFLRNKGRILHISGIAAEDSNAVVSCEAENDLGKREDFVTLSVNVEHARNFNLVIDLLPIGPTPSHTNSIASFYCKVDQTSPQGKGLLPSYKWYFHGLPIDQSSYEDRFIFERHASVIHITQISRADVNKRVTCEVTILGKAAASKDQTIKVEDNPPVGNDVFQLDEHTNSHIVIKIPREREAIEIESRVTCSDETLYSGGLTGFLKYILDMFLSRVRDILITSFLLIFASLFLAVVELYFMNIRFVRNGKFKIHRKR